MARTRHGCSPHPKAKPGRLAADLTQEVLERLTFPEPARLRTRLQDLAEVLTKLPGIRGAAVVALDEEEEPLTSGAHRLQLSCSGSELEALFRLRQQLEPSLRDPVWKEVDSSTIAEMKGETLRVLPVGNNRRTLGLVLAAVGWPSAESNALRAIARSGTALAAAIQSSIRYEAWSRIDQLQRLASDAISQPQWDLKSLVKKLATLFEAGAVTILLKEHEELRLSASTDEQLARAKNVMYQRGEGLTGHVLEVGKAVRLNNSKDGEEIKRVIGFDRRGPKHPERDREGVMTGQFLGVPMRSGKRGIGVIRMSRKQGTARFTLEDEKALQFFADLLGAALAHSWDLLLKRSVLESVKDAVVITRWERGEEGGKFYRIVMANAGAENLLGKRREDIEGRDAREIYAPGEYERIWDALKPSALKARKQGFGEFGPVESYVVRSGGIVPLAISYRLLANNLVWPPTLYTIGMARDRSESERQARQAEQHRRLMELLGAMKIAYFRADAEGFTIESTRTDSEITGYSAEDLKERPRQKLYEDPGARGRLLQKARMHEGQLLRESAQMRRKNGEVFWAEGDLRILKDAKGKEIGSEGLYRDVSERIRLQGFLNEDIQRVLSDDELFARLKRDAEFHMDYISSVSHQLQTPLGSLVETLRNFERGELAQKDLASRLPYVIGQAVVCTRLVRNLSYMDKILRGGSFQRERVSLAKLAIETKLDFSHLLKERELELQIDDASLDHHVVVRGHRELLRQVMVNLVDNAVKYSIPGTAVHVRGRKRREGGCFEITSQGLPITGEERELIFRRGFRTRGAQALVPHGTGLGLWLVRKIVEAHNATIRCLEVMEGGQKRILFRILFEGRAATLGGGSRD